MADVIETDYTTDPPTVTERAFTPEETAQRKADAEAAAAAEAASAAAAVARDEVKRRLAALGLTVEDLRALGL